MLGDDRIPVQADKSPDAARRLPRMGLPVGRAKPNRTEARHRLGRDRAIAGIADPHVDAAAQGQGKRHGHQCRQETRPPIQEMPDSH